MKCRTCNDEFEPDASTGFSENYCSPACKKAWERYDHRLRDFDTRMRKWLDGKQAKRPSPVHGLYVPTDEEKEESRLRQLEKLEKRALSRGAVVTTDDRIASSLGVPEKCGRSWRRQYSRVCHGCGRPCNNYWCSSCWAERRRKYHITDTSAWRDDD